MAGVQVIDKTKVDSVADALKHPTWQMGRKITIDSATLMNKGLEVIEAHLLFGVAFDDIEVVVHPTSVVHSMVEFHDGSTIAQNDNLSSYDSASATGFLAEESGTYYVAVAAAPGEAGGYVLQSSAFDLTGTDPLDSIDGGDGFGVVRRILARVLLRNTSRFADQLVVLAEPVHNGAVIAQVIAQPAMVCVFHLCF